MLICRILAKSHADTAAGIFTFILFSFIVIGIVLLCLYNSKKKTIFKIDYSGGSIGFDLRLIKKEEAEIFQKTLRQYKDLAERQNSANVQVNGGGYMSAADELRKYNELLNQGIISLEDFEAKKRQLLKM